MDHDRTPGAHDAHGEDIDAEPFDVAVDFVVTDGNGVIRCTRVKA